MINQHQKLCLNLIRCASSKYFNPWVAQVPEGVWLQTGYKINGREDKGVMEQEIDVV